MKKLLSILLAVVMMLSTITVFASNTADIVISGSDVMAKPGDTIKVPLVIEKNSGFTGLNLYFTYPDELTFVSLTNSVSSLTCTSNVTTVWDGADDYTGTGELAVLTFTVSKNAEYKGYPIEICPVEAYDVDLNELTISTTSATILVDASEDDTTHTHTDANGQWESDEVNHFRTCGCGTKFDTAAHSGGTATCTAKAKCSVCGQEYGAVDVNNHTGGTTIVNKVEANHTTQTNGYTGDTQCLGCNQIIAYGQTIPADSHTPATTWATDGTYHWKECAVSGCGVVMDGTKEAHTPDHQGSATEDYAIKCTACYYEIEAQLAHTHVYDKEVVKEVYKASNATCDNAATYYKSCKCGAFQSNETFSYGEPAGHRWADATCTTPKTCGVCGSTEGAALGHTEGDVWVKDYMNHWHICTVSGCGAVIESSKAAHTPDREEPTETDDVKCTECGLVLATLNPPHYHVHGKEWKYDHYEHWNECSCSNKAFIARHADTNQDGKCDTCGYGVPVVATTTVPTSPKTGHNSMVWIWTTLAGLFGFACVVANVLRKKK